MRKVAEHVAAAHGCLAEVDLIEDKYFPVTVNDAGAVDRTLAVAQSLIGPVRVVRMPSPVMAFDNWSYIPQQVRGSMALLGAAPPGVAHPAPNHSNRMVIDETVIATGIALNTAMALSWAHALRSPGVVEDQNQDAASECARPIPTPWRMSGADTADLNSVVASPARAAACTRKLDDRSSGRSSAAISAGPL